jgi:dipeptide/tripeptide permease
MAAIQVMMFEGTAYVTPLIGAYVADSYWGRYKTILVFSVIYLLVSRGRARRHGPSRVGRGCRRRQLRGCGAAAAAVVRARPPATGAQARPSLNPVPVADSAPLPCPRQGMVALAASSAVPGLAPIPGTPATWLQNGAMLASLGIIALGTGAPPAASLRPRQPAAAPLCHARHPRAVAEPCANTSRCCVRCQTGCAAAGAAAAAGDRQR